MYHFIEKLLSETNLSLKLKYHYITRVRFENNTKWKGGKVSFIRLPKGTRKNTHKLINRLSEYVKNGTVL